MISGGGAQAVAQAEPVQAQAALPQPRSFEEVVALVEARKDLTLRTHLMNDVRLVAFEVGKIELMPLERAPRDLAARLSGALQDWTGRRWMVALSAAGGKQTLREQEQSEAVARRQRLAQNALVQQVAKALGGTLEEMIVTPRQSFLPSAPLAPLDPDAELLDETGDFSVDDGDFLDHTF
jgi:DNA polymerase-3 subunit gamma/tau